MTSVSSNKSSTVDVSIKQSEVETSSYQQGVSNSQISINDQLLSMKNSLLNHYTEQKKSFEDQPIPTKEVQHGKRTVTETDYKEQRELEAKIAASKAQIADAQSAIEAIQAKQDELKGENINQEAQTSKAQGELSAAQGAALNSSSTEVNSNSGSSNQDANTIKSASGSAGTNA